MKERMKMPLTESLKCPSCGSNEVLPHAKGTFTPDGLICISCGHVFPGEWPAKPKIIIKGWRTQDGRKVGG